MESSKTIIRNFINSLGPQNAYTAGSVRAWWAINSLYYNHQGVFTDPTINLVSEVTDNYSQGSANITDGHIHKVVVNGITQGLVPKDEQGVYLVLTSKDVHKIDFCKYYCGWHSSLGLQDNGTWKVYKYAFVGDANRCPGVCSAHAPNGDYGIDGMVSTIAHELTETSSNPTWAWYNDTTGKENADMCSWRYGMRAGKNYNLVGLNGQKFAIQQNWNPITGKCVNSVDPPPPPPAPSPPLLSCDAYFGSTGRKQFSLGTVSSYNTSALVTLYSSAELEGERSRFQSSSGSCANAEISPVKSLRIQWSASPDSSHIVGCKNISLWTEQGCQGRKYSFQASPMGPNTMDKVVHSLDVLEEDEFDWTVNVKSVGCET